MSRELVGSPIRPLGTLAPDLDMLDIVGCESIVKNITQRLKDTVRVEIRHYFTGDAVTAVSAKDIARQIVEIARTEREVQMSSRVSLFDD